MSNMSMARAEEDFLTPPEATVRGECRHCGCDLADGDEYVESDSHQFCDTDCAVEYMIEHMECREVEEEEDDIELCTCCDSVINENYLVYDGQAFCDKDCLGKFLINNGEAEELVVGQ